MPKIYPLILLSLVVAVLVGSCAPKRDAGEASASLLHEIAQRQLHSAVGKATPGPLRFDLKSSKTTQEAIFSIEVRGYENALVCRQTKTVKPTASQWKFEFRASSDEILAIQGPTLDCRKNSSTGPTLEDCARLFAAALQAFNYGMEDATIHGFAWPSEVANAGGSGQQLSRRRIESVHKWLQHADLPSIRRVHAHGTSRTNSLPEERSQALGAYIQLDAKKPIPQFEQYVGEPLTQSEYVRFVRFMRQARSDTGFDIERPFLVLPMVESQYSSVPDKQAVIRLSPGSFWTYRSARHSTPDARELHRWATRLFANKCDMSGVGLPK